ncbi:hypothetical protein B0J14DRAFT_568004 [Halenospora varia]|nr:hypothetical protein B0J14DRAFT_568004 [Halenospora varia]
MISSVAVHFLNRIEKHARGTSCTRSNYMRNGSNTSQATHPGYMYREVGRNKQALRQDKAMHEKPTPLNLYTLRPNDTYATLHDQLESWIGPRYRRPITKIRMWRIFPSCFLSVDAYGADRDLEEVHITDPLGEENAACKGATEYGERGIPEEEGHDDILSVACGFEHESKDEEEAVTEIDIRPQPIPFWSPNPLYKSLLGSIQKTTIFKNEYV